mgnify:CR=1 FL=1
MSQERLCDKCVWKYPDVCKTCRQEEKAPKREQSMIGGDKLILLLLER